MNYSATAGFLGNFSRFHFPLIRIWFILTGIIGDAYSASLPSHE